MQFTKSLLRYSPLRRSVNRLARKTGRFLWNILPDVLVIFGSATIFMVIWEICFWH